MYVYTTPRKDVCRPRVCVVLSAAFVADETTASNDGQVFAVPTALECALALVVSGVASMGDCGMGWQVWLLRVLSEVEGIETQHPH